MYYNCPTYKSTALADPHRLSELEESRGTLLRVFEAEGQCIAIFEWGAISLSLGLTKRLDELVGKKSPSYGLMGATTFAL